MKSIIRWLTNFFTPPATSPFLIRALPYITLGVLTLILLVSSAYAWDYSNSQEFCGTTCHTMPPEYTAYLSSPHARVKCVECHLGRGFIATRITRKAGDAKHIISLALKNYEFPLKAKELRPARETCERCHYPQKFSDDSLREIKNFKNDLENSPETTYLILKTGGGSTRTGLGHGIHWHIENPVLFLPLDKEEQIIPYIQVIEDDGSKTEYVDIESNINPSNIDQENLVEMDCISCHNRISHLVYQPEEILDRLLSSGLIPVSIPEIKSKSVEVLRKPYQNTEMAINGIAGLDDYYRRAYPDYYLDNSGVISETIASLQDVYQKSVFPEQKSDWSSHPNNIGHLYSPGCFRCHDGKHLNQRDEAVRLECNICHSIPLVTDPYDFVAEIEIPRGPEPQSHLNANWITIHRSVFDDTCSNCHTTENPGGTNNTSFCSNSACHGNIYEFAGFDAPNLRKVLADQLPPTPTPAPLPTGEPLTFDDAISQMFQNRCVSCHGVNGISGLDLSEYTSVMAGSSSGKVIIPGEPEDSLLITKQTEDPNHFGKFLPEELDLVVQWILNGAPKD